MDKQMLIALVQRAQKGDSDALSELFAAYRNEVYSIAMQQTKNRTLSEDIVQETFLEVILKIEDLKQPASFPAWLKVLTYHQCTRYYKKKETIHEVSADENEDGFSVLDTLEETNAEFLPDEAVDQAEFRATILGMVDALPGPQRAALYMFYYEQFPLKLIAKVQGVSVNTANTRLNRGRIAVKDSVETYEKKHGIRLHTLAFLPFFRWLVQDTEQEMPKEAVIRVTDGIMEQTGLHLETTVEASASSVIKGGSFSTSVACTESPNFVTAMHAGRTVSAVSALKSAATGMVVKVCVGISAISVIAGGVAVSHNIHVDRASLSAHSSTSIPETAILEIEPRVDTATFYTIAEDSSAPTEEIHVVSDMEWETETTAKTIALSDDITTTISPKEPDDTSNIVTDSSEDGEHQNSPPSPAEDNQTEETTSTHTHSYDSRIIAPTCIEDGYTLYECVCGDNYTNDIQPKLDHPFRCVSIPPSGSCSGYDILTCNVCGYQQIDNYSDLVPSQPQSPHSFQSRTVPPTRTCGGYDIFKCEICGYRFFDNYTEPDPSITTEEVPEIDPDEYYGDCPKCGRMLWTSYYPSGCFTYLEDTICDCGQLVHAMECHHH